MIQLGVAMREFEFDRVSRLGKVVRHRPSRSIAFDFLQGMGSVMDIYPVVNASMPKLGLYRKVMIAQAKQLRRAKEVLSYERAKVRQLRNANG